MVLAAAALALLMTVILALVRASLARTLFDRLQAANTIGTCAMLLLAVLGFFSGRPEFLDLALTYGLLNAIGTFAVLKFLRQGDLGMTDLDANPTPKCQPMTEWMVVALDWASSMCLLAGAFFCVVGGIGLIRMPDFYTRMHAASVTKPWVSG